MDPNAILNYDNVVDEIKHNLGNENQQQGEVIQGRDGSRGDENQQQNANPKDKSFMSRVRQSLMNGWSSLKRLFCCKKCSTKQDRPPLLSQDLSEIQYDCSQ